MGKGFNNYMCKKFFHPASRDNLKRVWMAEQQAEAYKKKQEELRNQYEKEQDLHENKAILSKESKDKLSINFMYEPPPGVRKEREKDDNEPEYKFEWQRKYNAPRESYCKGDTEIRDQPFGIQVRNVRCIKCHKWGHINTDKECTMYSISMSEARKLHSEAEVDQVMSKGMLEEQMKEDGLAMRKSAMSLQSFQSGRLHQMVPDDDGKGIARKPETEFLKQLTKKQKKKLLKKLDLIEKASKKREKKKRKSNSDSQSESNSESDNDEKKRNKRSHRSRSFSVSSPERISKKHSSRRSPYRSSGSNNLRKGRRNRSRSTSSFSSERDSNRNKKRSPISRQRSPRRGEREREHIARSRSRSHGRNSSSNRYRSRHDRK